MTKLLKYWQIITAITVFGTGALLLSVAVASEKEEMEQIVQLENVPNSVQEAIETDLHGEKVTAVTKERDHGFTTYEAEYETQGLSRSIKLSESGTILEREVEVVAESLPADVLAKIQKEFPGATIKESEVVVSTYYEVILDTGKKKEREIKVFANGQSMGEDEDE